MSQRRAERQCGKLFGSAGEECIGSNDESAGAQLDQGRESRIDLPCGAARVWSNGSVRTVRCRPVSVGYVRVASVRPPYTKSEGKPVVLGMRASNPFRNVALLRNLNHVVIASQCSQHPGAVRRLSRIVRLKAAAYVHYRCSASALALACVVSRSKSRYRHRKLTPSTLSLLLSQARVPSAWSSSLSPRNPKCRQ